MNSNSIPGWTIKIEEIVYGIFKVTLTDAYGRKAEIIDQAIDETVERAKSAAFDIEKQISSNWNLFLYNLCLQKLSGVEIGRAEFEEKTFGSWVVEINNKRLIFDGKDSWLILQTKSNYDWMDTAIIKNNELNYFNFLNQINSLL